MSSVAIEKFTVPLRRPRSQAYPFDEWMDGKLRIARKGIDFWSTASEFHHTLRKSVAGNDQLSVTARVCCEHSDGEPDAVVFQYYKPGEVCVDLRRLILGRNSAHCRVPSGLFGEQKAAAASSPTVQCCTPVFSFFVPGQLYVTPPAA